MQIEESQKNSKFEIIGKDHQILQLILYPNDSIRIKPSSIIYQSPNIKCMFDLKILMRQHESTFESKVNLYRNESQTLGYLGISLRIGKIMVFNIEEHEDINFREQNLLAFDSFLKVTKATGQKFTSSPWSCVQMTEGKEKSNQLFFLQSTSLIIEKELGPDEEIMINRNCLFAYSSKVKLLDRKLNLIKLKGPGKVRRKI